MHGFPESWYSWRHQLPALAAAGYRAVAIDVRGYGRSSKPEAVAAYRMLDLVEDNVAVVRGPGRAVRGDRRARLGSDHRRELRPRPAGSVPRGRAAERALHAARRAAGPARSSRGWAATEEFYVSYFQEPGRAEAEIEPDVRGWLAGFYAALSADTMPAPDAPDPHFVSRGGTLRDRFPAGRLPAWLSEDELDVYAGEFERTGMAGALNRYRNMDRDWEDLAGFDGAPITQPSLFVGGSLDASTTWLADAIKAYPTTLPGLWSPRTSSTAAATGSSRNAPRRSTGS